MVSQEVEVPEGSREERGGWTEGGRQADKWTDGQRQERDTERQGKRVGEYEERVRRRE